jgi:hypothetical protein
MRSALLSRRDLLISAAATALLGSAGLAAAQSALPIRMYKDPWCGCCTEWARYLEGQGFAVTIEVREDLAAIKTEHGVPDAVASCHTAVIESYVIEGHVPAFDIKRLVAERPDAIGLAVPGMPIGSPGMEVPGQMAQSYDVFLIHRDGSTSVFAQHG